MGGRSHSGFRQETKPFIVWITKRDSINNIEVNHDARAEKFFAFFHLDVRAVGTNRCRGVAAATGRCIRSGNRPDEVINSPLGLVAAIPLTDGLYASPVISDGKVFVMDGSGVVFAIDAGTQKVLWKFATAGGAGNCNNVAAPAVVGNYLHVGTTAGYYYVLDKDTGKVVKTIDCREPIFSAPAVGDDRVYFATLGARVYAVSPKGEVAWTWDFVKEVVKFDGDRWRGEDWLKARGDRVTWRDHFVCSRDICLVGKTVVMPAGGRTVFLEDAGDGAKLRSVGVIPNYAGSEYPATFGQSADDKGNVYVQWHRRDNAGRVELMHLDGDKIEYDYVKGTETSIRLPGLLSFSQVSIRGDDIYRVRPEQGFGLCRYTKGSDKPEVLCEAGAICPPVLTRDHAVYGGLDGILYIVPLDGGEISTFSTAFRAPITASVAVQNGKVYICCEDGYLYILGPAGQAALPAKDLELWKIRSPLTGPFAAAKYDWYTNYGDFQGSNANDQGLKPPLRMRWAKRLEGTIKHLPVCGGGRLYTHTAEGQVIACEQDTGRILWRRYWPDVYLSFTSPLYINGKLLVPQAGLKKSRMRCLDAATGRLLWEKPFTGTPNWSRQFPPVVEGSIAIYASGDGEYAPQGSEKPWTFGGTPAEFGGREVMSWIYSNDNPYYPKDNRPRLWAWDLEYRQGAVGEGFLQVRPRRERLRDLLAGWEAVLLDVLRLCSQPTPAARSACREQRPHRVPRSENRRGHLADDRVLCHRQMHLERRGGRIYIGGNNRPNEDTNDRYVWCLDAKDGSLIWRSDPVTSALNVVTVGERFIFSNALRGKGNVFDRKSGKIVSSIGHNYACCRFTLSEPYVLGANMDMIDLSQDGKLVSTGPAIDSRECLGAVVSNGRIFYASQASGFVVSQTYGPASKSLPAVWERNGEVPMTKHQ